MNSQHTLTFNSIAQYLLNNHNFITTLRTKLNSIQLTPTSRSKIHHPPADLSINIDAVIQQLYQLIQKLIHEKLQKQMQNLISDNNAVLQQLKQNIQKNYINTIKYNNTNNQDINSTDTSFTQIHYKVTEEKRRMLEYLMDTDLDKSISLMEQQQQYTQKFNQLQKKVKNMQQKYQTNFKSLWNVVSMTQAAVFQHVKQNKVFKIGKINTFQPTQQIKKQIKNQTQEKTLTKVKSSNSLFSFWK